MIEAKDKGILERKENILKITELIGLIAGIIALCSVITTILFKYISLGRCLFFDFDLNYYDFSLSNTSKFVFILSLMAGIISAAISLVSSLIRTKTWELIEKLKKNTRYKKRYKMETRVVIIALDISIIILIAKLFIIEKTLMVTFIIMIIVFSSLIYIIIYMLEMNLEKRKLIMPLSIICSIIVFFLAPICMQTQYNEAKNQSTFPIIIERTNEKKEYYVVISEGKEKYSAYKCFLTEEDEKGILNIVTDVHKYFDINDEKTVLVKFNEIKKIVSTPLTVNEIIGEELFE